jgi:hypothetical protein
LSVFCSLIRATAIVGVFFAVPQLASRPNQQAFSFAPVARSLYYCGAPLSAILANRVFYYMRYRVCADLHVASAEPFGQC